MAATDPALDDPFYAELRRRHPDVDVVLLPPVDPTPPDAPPAPLGVALATRRHAVAVLDALWTRVGIDLDPPAEVWWQQADPHVYRFVVKNAATGLEPGTGQTVTTEVARALLDLGWEPQPSPADQPSLRARVGALDVEVTGFDSAVAVEITSDPLHLAPETREALEQAS